MKKVLIDKTNVLYKYSNLEHLKRVIAYCLRFTGNSKQKDKNKRMKGDLSATELNAALSTILKLTQAETFHKEIQDLSQDKQIHPSSSLYKLSPYLDQGLLRVGGRLDYSNLDEPQKHPIVLPKGHQVTKLLIQNEHVKRLHAGLNATLYGVREKYWPIDSRNMTRYVIGKCVRCFRAKPRETDYLMSALPKERVTSSRPFAHSGVDYCGPFFVKEKRFRNTSSIKTYVAVFVCFSTKAVHLELVSDLSSESFLSSLKRFFARRGEVISLHSDNATNFIGAKNELKQMFNHIDSLERSENTQAFVSKRGVNWHFIPPRAPHQGGLWEAAVKSFKTHFTRVAANALLTYEQLNTYVIEIEAILNSRPLSTLSSDPNDCLPLTPGHFLIGSSLTTFPQEDFRQVPTNRLSCWEHAQYLKQHFWDRWSREYLNEMIHRSKWNKPTDPNSIKIGSVVVVKEDNLPPLSWKLARITELHSGRDGLVRTVTINISGKTFKRSLKSLYPLPVDSAL